MTYIKKIMPGHAIAYTSIDDLLKIDKYIS